MNAAIRAALAMACAVASLSGQAAGNDELWEVTTQINMAGMPAGMGNQTQQICRDKDPKKEAASRRDMQNCKVTDMKESGNRFTMTLACPDGPMVVEQTYNAARTEYKGTMRMTSRDGDMTMAMQGRKIGACDAQQARGERESKAAAAKAEGDRALAMSEKAQADAAAQQKKTEDAQIKQCAAAVETMDMRKLGNYARCNETPEYCGMMQSNEHTKRVATSCMTSQAQFCKRYQTIDGFLQAKGDEQAAKMCKVSREQIAASHCPRASETENLAYLGRFCLAESKPLAQQYCARRDYTSVQGGKYADFCTAYLSQADLEGPKPGKNAAEGITEGVSQGVTQGINKLKGLFGK